MSVDALVADSDADAPVAQEMFNASLDGISRSSTPNVPPGLNIPHAHPSPEPRLDFREEPVDQSSLRILPTSASFTPSRATSSVHVSRAATPLAKVSVPPTQTALKASVVPLEPKRDVRSVAVNTPKVTSTQGGLALQPEDFPSLEAGRPKEHVSTKAPASKKSTVITTPILKKHSSTPPTPFATPSGPKSNAKRSVAANVPATGLSLRPVNETESRPLKLDTFPKQQTAASDFPALPPSAPTSASVSSPAIRNAPKTLRVVLPTSKTEIPAKAENGTGLSAPSSASSMNPPPLPVASRQPSLASVTRLEGCGTPVSEMFSDNASITTASVSRASSPPPSRVGSAPVRANTKAQQKKQRREMQKKKEESEIENGAEKPDKEVEVGPIMGRMKKQKKAKPSAASGSTPLASRPPSPGPLGIKDLVAPSPTEVNTPVVAEEVAPGKSSEAKVKNSEVEHTVPEPIVPAPVEEPQPAKVQPTPASVFPELVSSGVLPVTDPMKLSIFGNFVGLNFRYEPIEGPPNVDQSKLIITDDDRISLKEGRPVRKILQGTTRMMLTPNGDCVRNLNEEEEDKYLELQERILKDHGPLAFSSPRQNSEKAFALIGGRAVPNGPPSFFPTSADANLSKFDPVSRIQRDEALNYINQYVLPSLSANSQLEKALNASALDAGGAGPGPVHHHHHHHHHAAIRGDNWTAGLGCTHGGGGADDDAASTRPYGVAAAVTTDGILASGLESMTAHFGTATEHEGTSGAHLGNVTLLPISDTESALQTARKETERLERTLHQLLKKNRRLLLGSAA